MPFPPRDQAAQHLSLNPDMGAMHARFPLSRFAPPVAAMHLYRFAAEGGPRLAASFSAETWMTLACLEEQAAEVCIRHSAVALGVGGCPNAAFANAAAPFLVPVVPHGMAAGSVQVLDASKIATVGTHATTVGTQTAVGTHAVPPPPPPPRRRDTKRAQETDVAMGHALGPAYVAHQFFADPHAAAAFQAHCYASHVAAQTLEYHHAQAQAQARAQLDHRAATYNPRRPGPPPPPRRTASAASSKPASSSPTSSSSSPSAAHSSGAASPSGAAASPSGAAADRLASALRLTDRPATADVAAAAAVAPAAVAVAVA